MQSVGGAMKLINMNPEVDIDGDSYANPRPAKKCISGWLLPKIELLPSQQTLMLQMDRLLDY